MQLKTYSGPDLASALARAREEAGPSALVLATNEVKGRLGLTRVEVTVGIDRTPARASARAPEPPAAPPATIEPGLHPALSAAYESMVRSGLDAGLARRFARGASGRLGPNPRPSVLTRAAEDAMRDLVPIVSRFGSRVLFLVGPPGAGKSTTAAKIAGSAAAEGHEDVVVIEADDVSAGSLATVRRHSTRLGYRTVVARTPDEVIRCVREAGRSATVIVDTFGVGASDRERGRRLRDLSDAFPGAEVALVIPAGIHGEEARRVIERFRPLQPTCAVISKADDGSRPGEILTALIPERLPIAFITHGHRVPEHLSEASPRGVTAMLLDSGFRADEELSR